MSIGNMMGSRQRKYRNSLSPDNVTVALKGSIKIRQLCWLVELLLLKLWVMLLGLWLCGQWSADLHPETVERRQSGLCFVMVMSNHGSVVVSFSASRSLGLCESTMIQCRLIDEAKWRAPRFPLYFTQRSSAFEVLWKISLKIFENHKSTGR